MNHKKRLAFRRKLQIINKPSVVNLGCMKGPQPLHFSSAGDGVYAAEEKICVAELAPAKQIFIPIIFSSRDAKHHSKICNPKNIRAS